MRGKDSKGSLLFFQVGITPAYAGKRKQADSGKWVYGDHPRICGEKALMSQNTYYGTGSPPHMRGKGLKACEKSIIDRITPAYAGKSLPY